MWKLTYKKGLEVMLINLKRKKRSECLFARNSDKNLAILILLWEMFASSRDNQKNYVICILLPNVFVLRKIYHCLFQLIFKTYLLIVLVLFVKIHETNKKYFVLECILSIELKLTEILCNFFILFYHIFCISEVGTKYTNDDTFAFR